MINQNFLNAAEYMMFFGDTEVFFDDEDKPFPDPVGFECPHCFVELYGGRWSDSETDNWLKCPVCGEYFAE